MRTKTARQIWEEAGKPLTGILLDNLLDEIEVTEGKVGRVEFLHQLHRKSLEQIGVKFDKYGAILEEY